MRQPPALSLRRRRRRTQARDPPRRYLQTLTEIGTEQNSTMVFRCRWTASTQFLDLAEKSGKPAAASAALVSRLRKMLLWSRKEGGRVGDLSWPTHPSSFAPIDARISATEPLFAGRFKCLLKQTGQLQTSLANF